MNNHLIITKKFYLLNVFLLFSNSKFFKLIFTVNSMKSIMHLFEELVKEKCGNDGVKILKLLEGKENVSEFKISDDINMNINELRAILYKLTEDNLIISTRKKDKQKGWYVYYWTFNFRHARDLLLKRKESQLQELKHKLGNPEVPKYVCPNGCISLFLEDAMEIEFKCPECSSLLKLREIKYDEEVIKKKIKEVEEDIEKIRQEVIIEVAEKEKKEKKELKKVKRIKKKKPEKKLVKKKKLKKKIKKLKKIRKQKIKKKKIIKKLKKIKKKQKKQRKKKQGLLHKLKKRIRF